MKNKKTKPAEKIINIILNILIFIFGIILLISIYNGIQVKILGKDYSDFFGYSTFEVQSGSMEDEISIGDWIIVKKSNNFKLNDIVTYEQDGEFITHRIIEAYKGTYVTQGDANNTKDEPITQEQIVGKVVKILPIFGKLRKTIFNPIILITLIVTIYIVSFIIKSMKKSEKENTQNNISDKIDELLKTLIEKLKATKEKPVKEKIVKEKKPRIKKEKKSESLEVKSVNVGENKEQEYNIEDLKEEALAVEDTDKTMFFRAVSVDKSEIDSTYLEIAETELEKDLVDNLDDIDEEELDDDSFTKKNLELLQKNKKKKFENIIDKVMFIKTEELNEISNILNQNEKLKVNEPSIKEEMIKSYIDGKYYNFCGNVNAEYNKTNATKKIEEALKEKALEMTKSYKGTDTKYKDKVNKYCNMFILIFNLEQAAEVITEIKPKRELYRKKILKYIMSETTDEEIINKMVESIIKSQRIYHNMIEYSLKKLDTNTFELTQNKLTTNKKIFGVELNHNIAFSKVYSDYIVDKTYTEGVIAEDKIVILISLLQIQLVKDMFSSDFKKKYILYIPESLYTKESKLSKLLKMMEDEYAKNNIIILLKYEELLKNKKVIKNLRKEGYKFAVVFEQAVEIKAKDQANLYLMEYMFIDKKTVKSADMLLTIPQDLLDKIAYEDVASKVGNFGGE